MLDHEIAARLYRLVPAGRMAEWLCRGLQILVRGFDSLSGLQAQMLQLVFIFGLSCPWQGPTREAACVIPV